MKQLSFRAKIMIVFITIGILQGGIMGYFAYSHARSLIFNNKKNEMENMLEKINISVTDKVSYMTQLGQSTATSQIVRNNIHSGEDYLQVGRSKRNIAEYFSSLVLSFEPLNNIMIIDRSNILYSTYDYYRLQDFDLVSSQVLRGGFRARRPAGMAWTSGQPAFFIWRESPDRKRSLPWWNPLRIFTIRR
ncbi:MAG: hypothetical protein ACLSAC_18755 [Enterocloster bolteae]